MFKRIVVRVVRLGLLIVGVTLTGTLFAGYLALSEPTFYVERLAMAATPAEQAAAKAQFERAQAAAVEWLAASTSRQQAALANGAAPAGGPGAIAGSYDPTCDVHVFRATERQLNALLAAQERGAGDGLRNLRVRLGDNGVELGAELCLDAKPSSRSIVVSVLLQPTLRDDGTLRLDIQSARAGRLPIPLRMILRCLPRPIVYAANDGELDLNPEAPHLAIKLPRSDAAAPTIKSIRCAAGEIVVELLPPVLPPSAA
jgi:hypothetical protein